MSTFGGRILGEALKLTEMIKYMGRTGCQPRSGAGFSMAYRVLTREATLLRLRRMTISVYPSVTDTPRTDRLQDAYVRRGRGSSLRRTHTADGAGTETALLNSGDRASEAVRFCESATEALA